MKFDIDEVKKTPEEIYQVGNVIESDGDLYLVVVTDEGYSLLNFELNRVEQSYKTLGELAEEAFIDGNQLIDVKIVRA